LVETDRNFGNSAFFQQIILNNSPFAAEPFEIWPRKSQSVWPKNEKNIIYFPDFQHFIFLSKEKK
jgi:hypothetical protein